MRYSENKEIGAYSVEVKYIKVVLLSQSEKKSPVWGKKAKEYVWYISPWMSIKSQIQV